MRPNQTAPPEIARGPSFVRPDGEVGPRATGSDGEAVRGPAAPTGSDKLEDATRTGLKRRVTERPFEAMGHEVERRMLRGERFTDVEDAINSSDLSADEKAALWLLGWSYVHPRAQRREANAHLTALTAATPPRTSRSRRHLRILL
jgi:hypothetical protein